MRRAVRKLDVLVLCALSAGAAHAEAPSLEMGRYLSKYPAMYSTLSFSSSARDEIFDAQGAKAASAVPTYGMGNGFGEKRASMQFEWHFPMFETEALPFVSSRLWTARATFGWSQLDTSGPITSFIAANKLVENADGLNDVQLEFGPLLWGSKDWRTRKDTPFSLMLLAQAQVPVGQRSADSPNNAGVANAFGFGGKLGMHWRPLPRVYLDAGAGWKHFLKNEEPAFGAQEPRVRGDEQAYDLSVNARLFGSVYAGLSGYRREGGANTYQGLRFSANPPAAGAGNVTFPDPAPISDQGTLEQGVAASLRWFFTPRVSAALHYLQPRSGRSGEFDVPYLQRTSGCPACATSPNGSDHVDGLGAARSWANETWMLSLAWNYGQGDFWLKGD